MQLGFVSAIMPELSFERVLRLARQLGLNCVEMMCWPAGRAERKYAGVTHVDVTQLSRGRIDSIHESCAKHKVAISALGYYPNLLNPDLAGARKAAAHFKKVIHAADMLSVRTVTTFAGRDWQRSIDENWRRFLNVWKPLIALAEDHGVRIAFENCPMLFTRDEWPGGKNLASSPALWRRIFSDLSSPNLGLNYDPSHQILQFMDPIAPLREFRSKLFHLHAKDVKIDRKRLDDVGVFAYPLQWHQPRIPGHGEMDWSQYIGAVREVGYKGPICIEVEDETFGVQATQRRQALQVATNVLAPLIPEAGLPPRDRQTL